MPKVKVTIMSDVKLLKIRSEMTSYVLCKTLVLWLCSRSQPGIKAIIRDLRGHLLHTVTFLVLRTGFKKKKHLRYYFYILLVREGKKNKVLKF